MNNKRFFWWGMLALVLLVFGMSLVRPLAWPDEARYGGVGYGMLVSGDWLTPRLDGMPFFHKPPLLHWLQASSMAVFGVHVWSARLVPLAHAIVMLLSMYWATRYFAGEQVAQRACWILGTSLTIMAGGQYLNHDMPVAAWIGLAIWCFGGALLVQGKTGRRLALLGFVACGLGVLGKGLIGLVLPGLVIFVWLFVVRLWPRALHLPWGTGLLLFALVALPWFVLAQRQYPELFDYLIIGQHFRRYTGSTFNNKVPFWFYLPILAGLLFPWALLAAWDGLRSAWRQRLALLRQPEPWTALLWVWVIAITVFFSLPKSKLVGYILPVLPPLAVLAAQAWQTRWGQSVRAGRVFALLCAFNIGLALLLNHTGGQRSLDSGSRDVAQTLSARIEPGQAVWSTGGFPYDLAWLARLRQPVVVLDDWDKARREASDNWQRELFEGGDFDPEAAARWLQPIERLQQPPAGTWLVARPDMVGKSAVSAWRLVCVGRAWALWQARDSGLESPETAEHKGLQCGQTHGHEQGPQ